MTRDVAFGLIFARINENPKSAIASQECHREYAQNVDHHDRKCATYDRPITRGERAAGARFGAFSAMRIIGDLFFQPPSKPC